MGNTEASGAASRAIGIGTLVTGPINAKPSSDNSHWHCLPSQLVGYNVVCHIQMRGSMVRTRGATIATGCRDQFLQPRAITTAITLRATTSD